MTYQTTLKSSTVNSVIAFESVGLHSGSSVSLLINPAKTNHGIVFKRTDIKNNSSKQALIPARYDLVSDTRLGTTLTNTHGISISTVEHLMAALAGCGVDNALIEVSGAEVPIMDGSSQAFVEAIETAGIKTLSEHRKVLKVLKTVEVKDGESFASIAPNSVSEHGLGLDITIDFKHPLISKHQRYYDFSEIDFGKTLGSARTFGFEHEVEWMRSQGLARGGSLENAIVIGKEKILNPEGLRFADEFIRHKALDCLGDFFLAGCRIEGQIETIRPGHSINNKLLRALFADASAYEIVSTAPKTANSNIKEASAYIAL